MQQTFCISPNFPLSHQRFHHLIAIQHKPLNNPHLKPDYHDPNHYCCCCERTDANQDNYRSHLRKIHQIAVIDNKTNKRRMANNRRIANLNIIPAQFDPNNYCRACDFKYKSRRIYRSHLKTVHKMTLSPIKETVVRYDKAPDVSDPYRCACEKYYSDNRAYRKHLRGVLEMVTHHNEA